jgi:hypothetical protein
MFPSHKTEPSTLKVIHEHSHEFARSDVLRVQGFCPIPQQAEENEFVEDGEANKERNIGVLVSSPFNLSMPESPCERLLAGGCDAWRVAPARLPRGGRGV